MSQIGISITSKNYHIKYQLPSKSKPRIKYLILKLIAIAVEFNWARKKRKSQVIAPIYNWPHSVEWRNNCTEFGGKRLLPLLNWVKSPSTDEESIWSCDRAYSVDYLASLNIRLSWSSLWVNKRRAIEGYVSYWRKKIAYFARCTSF